MNMVTVRAPLVAAAAVCLHQRRAHVPTTAESEAAGGQRSVPRLVHATVLFRHGARTPVFTALPGLDDIEWPCCSGAANAALPAVKIINVDGGPRPPLSRGVGAQFNTTLKGGCFAGQLTDLGITQTDALGRRLRESYGAFVDLSDPDAAVSAPPPLPPAGHGGGGVFAGQAKVTVRSTNVPRCVASAQGMLNGLFDLAPPLQPGGGTPEAGAAAGRSGGARAKPPPQPFPVVTMPTSEEYAHPNTKACPRLGELWANARATWKARPDGDGAALLAFLKAKRLSAAEFKAFGLDEGNFIPARDLAVALAAHGLPQPPALRGSGAGGAEEDGNPGGGGGDVLARLDRLGGLQLSSLMGGGGGWHAETLTHRLSIGRQLDEVLARLANAAREDAAASAAAAAQAAAQAAAASGATGGSNPCGGGGGSGSGGSGKSGSLHLISAHDTTLVPVLTALGAYDGVWPDYASSVAFELWAPPHASAASASASASFPSSPQQQQQQQESLVRVVFNGVPLPVPGCTPARFSGKGGGGGDLRKSEGLAGPLYRLGDMRRALAPLVSKDLNRECRAMADALSGGDGDKF